MRAKRLTFGITTILVALALLVPTTAFAADDFVGTYTYDWITYDNGMGGIWATDFFHSQVSIWDLGDGYYDVVFVDGGSFVTLDGYTPGDEELPLVAGIGGAISGGVHIVVRGDLEESIPSHVGPIDYRGGGGWSNYLSPFFDDFRIVEWLDWGWAFASCGNGTWVDNEQTEAAYASDGPNDLMGNISGDPVPCEGPAEPVVRNLWAYVNPAAEDVNARGNICYILSKTQPTQSEEDNDVRRLCYTTSSPNWWNGAVLLTHGDVFENGTDWGYWEGDAAARAFSTAPRLPLHAEGPNNDLIDKAEMFPWTQ